MSGTFVVRALPNGIIEFSQEDEHRMELTVRLQFEPGAWTPERLAALEERIGPVADKLTDVIEAWRAYIASET